MTALKPTSTLKDIFGDVNYAWDLLEAEVRMETAQVEAVSGEDISSLLQLYMRGVEKMNTLVDIRQSFFKNKVTTLMSRPMVIKILNKPMTKKNQPAIVDCTSPQTNKKIQQKQEMSSGSAKKIMHTEKELQLKSKKQSLQMRLAYSAEQNNPDALKKMLAQHSHKQTLLTEKIVKIVDSHEERLRKRISERKNKTLTAKSRSDIYVFSEIADANQVDTRDLDSNFNNIGIEAEEAKYQQKLEELPTKITEFVANSVGNEKTEQKNNKLEERRSKRFISLPSRERQSSNLSEEKKVNSGKNKRRASFDFTNRILSNKAIFSKEKKQDKMENPHFQAQEKVQKIIG